MTQSQIIDKVRKLLQLAESPNANEAALAAAKAQQFIDEYNLSAALLAIETEQPETDEPIEDFQKKSAPLDSGKRQDRWRLTLASTIARSNGCRIYLSRNDIALVGRPSDADTVRYLFSYLKSEVNRLCERDGKGCGATWRNNYRLGVVDTITKKLNEQHEQFKKISREQVSMNPLALVKIDKALARIEAKQSSVQDWMKKNLRLHYSGRSSSSGRYDSSAREAGRIAGQSIAINKARGSISA